MGMVGAPWVWAAIHGYGELYSTDPLVCRAALDRSAGELHSTDPLVL